MIRTDFAKFDPKLPCLSMVIHNMNLSFLGDYLGNAKLSAAEFDLVRLENAAKLGLVLTLGEQASEEEFEEEFGAPLKNMERWMLSRSICDNFVDGNAKLNNVAILKNPEFAYLAEFMECVLGGF